MKLTKAIEVLQDLDTNLPQFRPGLRRAAVRLGIEALKRHKTRSLLTYAGMLQPLSGETLDDEGDLVGARR